MTTRRKPARKDRHLRPPISVRMPADLMAAVQTAARYAGQSRNAWIVGVCRREVYRQGIDCPAPAVAGDPPASR